MDRRALFFLGAAVVCAILIPVTEAEQRWVPIVALDRLCAAGAGVVGRPPQPAPARQVTR